jgi:hypothetical protein
MQPHVGGDRRPGHQRGFLEHEAEPARADGVRRPGLQPFDLAARRLAQAGDDAQRRGLAAAGGPEQRHELARPDIEIEPVERDHAVGKTLADAAQRDDGSAGGEGRGGGMVGHVAISGGQRLDGDFTRQSNA